MTRLPESDVTTLDELVGRLSARAPEHRIQPRLDATRLALDLLGNPQRAYRIIHITGTNGKTSTARMISAILRAHNLKVGLFTSPDLVSFTERIVIDGSPIPEAEMIRIWNEISPILDLADAQLEERGEARLTFFEALTVLGFAAFAEAPVDVVSLEVGMGGEWDATNVADGEVAVFTPIGLDHVGILGDTLGEIAQTKAGILKPGAIAVSSAQAPEALSELRARAEELQVPLLVQGDDFSTTSVTPGIGGQLVSVHGLADDYPDLALPLMGDYQAQNAAVAVAAVEAFLGGGKVPLHRELVAEGLAGVSSPGRLQVVDHAPTVIVDGAHNPHGAAALARSFPEYFHFPRTVGILCILGDKDAEGVLRALEPIFDSVVLTTSGSVRALSPDALAARALPIFGQGRITVADSLEEALDEARYQCGPDDGILVTGSLTLVGEYLREHPASPSQNGN